MDKQVSPGSVFDRIAEEKATARATAVVESQKRVARVGKSFYAQWVVATTLGWMLGEIVLTALGIPQQGSLLLGFTLYGAMIAIAQWFVLRPRLENARLWIVATILACAIGITLSTMVGVVLVWATLTRSQATPLTLGALAVSLIGVGAAIGFGQWLVLKDQVYKAGWWILVNLFILPVPASWIWHNSVGVLIGTAHGALVGLITGAVLLWLLRHPQKYDW